MRKIILIAFVVILSLGGVAWSSPLTDYGAGKGSVDLTWRNTEIDLRGYTTGNLPEKYTLDAAITFGLGNDFALQYRNFATESDIIPWRLSGVRTTGRVTFTTQELNILHKLGKDTAVFAGVVNAKVNRWTPLTEYTTETRNLLQLGVTGRASLAPKTALWASAAVGTDLTNLEIGLSYAFTANTEFNVSYRELETKDLKISRHSPVNAKAKGLGFGLTFKF